MGCAALRSIPLTAQLAPLTTFAALSVPGMIWHWPQLKLLPNQATTNEAMAALLHDCSNWSSETDQSLRVAEAWVFSLLVTPGPPDLVTRAVS